MITPGVAMDYSLEEAKRYSDLGRTEDWVHSFLLGPGNNRELSEGLKKAPRYWIGPILVPVARLERCCGPEEHQEFLEDAQAWSKRISDLAAFLSSGGRVPPVIAEYRRGRLSVRDGSHRVGAFEARKQEAAWALIWHNSVQDYQTHRDALAPTGPPGP